MAAPNIETIYDFEANWEDAAVTFLAAAVGIPAFRTSGETDLTTPRMEVKMEVGPALDPITMRDGGSAPNTKDYRAFEADFMVSIVTDNAVGQSASMDSYRRKLRQELAVSGTNWNNTNNPYYDLKYIRPDGTDYSSDGDFNVSTLKYSINFEIRRDSWPS